MKTAEQNGKRIKDAYKLLQTAGQGMKIAADTGYKTGYFMAKHPEVEMVKKSIQRNRVAILLALVGIVLGAVGIAGFMAKKKK
jgi:hypothetical protein